MTNQELAVLIRAKAKELQDLFEQLDSVDVCIYTYKIDTLFPKRNRIVLEVKLNEVKIL